MMNKLKILLFVGLNIGLGHQAFANDVQHEQYQQLLKTLEQPQSVYVPPVVEEKVDSSLYKNEYEVDWRSRPQFNITAQEYKSYKTPVKVKMTVIASTGYIGNAEVVKSSGSKKIDQKVVDAVKLARLDKIAHVDKNVTYTLIHDFDIKKPL